MSTSSRIVAACFMGIALIAIAVLSMRFRTSVPTPSAPVAASDPHAGKPTPPRELEGFWSWSPDRQERVATGLREESQLAPTTSRFIRQAIESKDLALVVRNNLAGALVAQQPADPDLPAVFAAMAERADEDPVWREYALQFLGLVTPPDHPERKRMTTFLLRLASDAHDARAGTAAIQLQRMAPHTQEEEDALDRCLVDMIATVEAPVPNRVTACALAGERRLTTALPALRAAARTQPAVRRVAIAAIGELSTDAEDDLLLKSAAQDGDPTVARVARAAIEARRMRSALPSGQ